MKKISIIFVLVILLSFYGCSPELFGLESGDGYRVSEKISFSQFNKETGISEIPNFQTHSFHEDLSLSGRTAESENLLSFFRIDTLNIKRLEKDEAITYSFPAYNYLEGSGKRYNIVYFHKQGKWNYSLLEIKNGPSSIPLYDSRVGIMDSEISVSKRCIESYQTREWSCKNHEPYNQCDKCEACFIITTHVVFYDCGSGGTQNPGNPIEPGNPGNGGGDILDPSPYFYDPNLPPDIDPAALRAMRAHTFWEQLQHEYKYWASQNVDLYLALLENYLDKYSHPDNTQNFNFHVWAIDFFLQNADTTWAKFENWFIKPITQQDIINELKDYPCAQSIVQQLPTLSNDIALAMRNVFQNNENYHIIFKAKSGLGDTDGVTFASSSNTGSFKAVINLNDQVLTKGTKEYILITMYHEVVHAFLDYERFRLGDIAFNSEYPSVLVGYGYNTSGQIINIYTFLPQHNQLGAFLSQLENILSTYNPNLPTETVKAMAKAGITTMTAQESQLNLNERDTTSNNHKGTKCP